VRGLNANSIVLGDDRAVVLSLLLPKFPTPPCAFVRATRGQSVDVRAEDRGQDGQTRTAAE